jgi:ATP-dependent Lon protease
LSNTDPPSSFPRLLAVPLTKRPLFPGFFKSMYIKEPKAIQAIQALWAQGNPYIGIFLAKNENSERDIVSEMSEVEHIGVFAEITNIYQSGQDNTSLTVVVFPHRRIKMTGIITPEMMEAQEVDPPSVMDPESKELTPQGEISSTPAISETPFDLSDIGVPLAAVENLHEEPYDHDDRIVKATANEVINILKEVSQLNPLLRDQIITMSVQTGNLVLEPSKLADFAAAVSSGEPQELQQVLESLVVEERLNRALVVLKKELANAKLQQEISKEVDKKISRKQQEYFLMEQLKGIKKELGMDGDGKEKLIERFKDKAKKLAMSEQIRTVFDEVCRFLYRKLESCSNWNRLHRNSTSPEIIWIG